MLFCIYKVSKNNCKLIILIILLVLVLNLSFDLFPAISYY